MTNEEMHKLRRNRIRAQIHRMRESVERMEAFFTHSKEDELDREAQFMENVALALRELLIGVA
jgi:hypothetical protein